MVKCGNVIGDDLMTGKTTSLILSLICWVNFLALYWYAIITQGFSSPLLAALVWSAVIAIVSGVNAMDKKK